LYYSGSYVPNDGYIQYLGVILSGIVFSWIKSANSLAGQFNKAMEVNDDGADEGDGSETEGGGAGAAVS